MVSFFVAFNNLESAPMIVVACQNRESWRSSARNQAAITLKTDDTSYATKKGYEEASSQLVPYNCIQQNIGWSLQNLFSEPKWQNLYFSSDSYWKGQAISDFQMIFLFVSITDRHCLLLVFACLGFKVASLRPKRHCKKSISKICIGELNSEWLREAVKKILTLTWSVRLK